MNSTYDPLVGHVLDDRYEILTKVEKGGMATVYRARDLRLMRSVAVKIMRRDLGEEDDFAAKFDHEARAAATLSHPAVVAIFDQGIAKGQPYIVMEFVEGETLRKLIRRESPLRPERALDLLEPMAAGLAVAHESGLVHRDIKPENVLISNRGKVQVTDFGLARVIDSPQVTATGVLVGTASYLPPELVLHGRPDSRSDIYSAGIVLYEMLTGKKPHKGENNYQIAMLHVNVDIEKPSTTLRRDRHTGWRIPDYVDAFVAACTARTPDNRPFNGRELLEQLREVRQQLTLTGDRDNPDLADRLRPEPSLPGDLKLPMQSRPAPRPRPVDAVPQASLPQAAPIKGDLDELPMWRPSSPRSPGPRSGRPQHPSPVSPIVEDSGHHPRMSRTPVFPNISQDPVHRRRRGAFLLLLILLVTAGAGVGSWWYTAGRFTTAPSVTLVSETAATQAAGANDLGVNTRTEYSEEVEAGLVISTDPTGGTRLLRGDTMELVISLGPERFGMPEVVGATLEDAKSALTSTNLAVGTITESWSAKVASGVVISASAEPETPLKRDTPIDLTVSKGPEPIAIANYEGREAARAGTELKDAGFRVKVTSENSATVGKGLVISQTPSNGNGKRDDIITLVESLGPVMVELPDVRYKSLEDATRQLETLGVKVEVEYVTDFPLSLKIASGTEPGRGTSVAEGSTVVLLVA